MGRAVGGEFYAVDSTYTGFGKSDTESSNTATPTGKPKTPQFAPPPPVNPTPPNSGVPLESVEIIGHMHKDHWEHFKGQLKLLVEQYPHVKLSAKKPHKPK